MLSRGGWRESAGLQDGTFAGVLGWRRKQASPYFSLSQKPSDVASMWVLQCPRALAETPVPNVLSINPRSLICRILWIIQHRLGSVILSTSVWFLPGLFKNNDLVSLSFKRIHFILTFLKACWISPEACLASWFRVCWKSPLAFGLWMENCLNVRGAWLIWEVIDKQNWT